MASFLCIEYGGSVGLYNSGFDPAHARLAPGIVLLAHLIRDAIERGVPVFDFLRGEESYKYDFGPTPEAVSSTSGSRRREACGSRSSPCTRAPSPRSAARRRAG